MTYLSSKAKRNLILVMGITDPCFYKGTVIMRRHSYAGYSSCKGLAGSNYEDFNPKNILFVSRYGVEEKSQGKRQGKSTIDLWLGVFCHYKLDDSEWCLPSLC